ncbi:gliding motility-associated ABC transporter substrate-binding protein GldG [Dysgonomonas sp. 521]|uniref:gliding motility-associated ABC transporter substrate-binding protein GldG n=1 Tax=Dysgonomonas sp. 521 TaxID=2302932 RepID=UPI0013D6DDEF|nr:gliding motility-associated ABC transporter substrate-binding protein GldG [Dysgonomonas sp. 521]NDV96804.1 gliding motility-associated ABC transporter substrate-binding protein GldG [Dysgonomonas sp. 521]
MKALVLKELRSVFCSSFGAFFSLAYLLAMGGLLWFFSGKYNFVDNGYADMVYFFDLSAVLLAFLVPALTMRSFAEERKNKTLDILRARPVSAIGIYWSKFSAVFIFVLATLLPTLIYVYSLSQLANPVGNIDLSSIAASYISLILIILVLISAGLFGSVVSRNQIVALIISVAFSLFVLYGFDLCAGLFLSGKIQSVISSLGLSYHYKLMQRGVIQLKDILVIANYSILFTVLSVFFLDRNVRKLFRILCLIILLNICFYFIPNFRIDFTADKRYTLSDYTISLLEGVGNEQPVTVDIYLTGDLNYGFQRLQNAVNDILNDYARYADNSLNIRYVNPYQEGDAVSDIYSTMSDRGMPGIVLNEMDREGKSSRKMIYPYAQLTSGKDTLVVSLLKNIAGYTAEENINASIEGLEFEFTDAIRLLGQKEPKEIAFIEGHNEVPQAYVYDAEDILAKYYFVNRGQIGNDVSVLGGFSAVIIAGPLLKYSETEKYVLDQYIMSGGKVLWLIDGAFYSHQDLAATGRSASMKNETNLDDMLFSYGIRVNPDLIQDRQCVSTYLISDDNTQSAVMVPSYFQPLLIPSQDFPITKNIRDVKAGFASSIDIVNSSPDILKNVLLTSSANTHLVKVPEVIDFDVERIQDQQGYFDQQFIPVAVSLEGEFTSVFQNRAVPDSVKAGKHRTINRSSHTKMVVVSSSDIITNDIQGKGENSQVLPMGYDRVSQQQFGNRDFIVNAVNWLTSDNGLMQLRAKQQKLYVLNKKAAYENRDKYAILNIGFPALFILLLMGSVILYRKRKYEK